MPKLPKDDLPNKEGFGKGGREVLRRTDWLDDEMVFWAGGHPGCSAAQRDSLSGFRSLRWVIESSLVDQSKGFYALKLDQAAGLNPVVKSIRPVSGKALASASHSVKVAAYRGKELERSIGEVEAWREAKTQKLNRYRAAIAALERRSPELEALAMWVGEEASKPSLTAPEAELVSMEDIGWFMRKS